MPKTSKPILMFIGIYAAIALPACDYFKETTRVRPTGDTSAKMADKSKSSMQTLCDIERTRARADILKRVSADKFHEFAVKVSSAITLDEIKDLQRLDTVAGGGSAWETGRARGELINEIYMGAILRAGFSPPETRTIEGTELKATVGIDPISVSNDRYAEFLIGQLTKELGPEGSISKISFAASPDQSRYFVRLYRLSRVETRPDGSPSPVFATESLFESAEQRVSRLCEAGDTALNIEEFNTIPGLDPDSNR